MSEVVELRAAGAQLWRSVRTLVSVLAHWARYGKPTPVGGRWLSPLGAAMRECKCGQLAMITALGVVMIGQPQRCATLRFLAERRNLPRAAVRR